MTRKSPLRKHLRALAYPLCALLTGALTATAGEPRRPNIVLIVADDLGINDLASYGRSEHHTPNLDALAAEGLRFTSAYAASPICSPSRAAILTGKDPARLHLTTYLPGRADCAAQKLLQPAIRQQLALEETTLAEHLKTAGYATACIGKWHLGGQGFGPSEQGFDVYHPGRQVTTPSASEGGKCEYDLTEEAKNFITAHREQPFFLYLAHHSPHIPYMARPGLVEQNKNAFEPVYAALIQTLDDAVGQLLARIDELRLSSETIVIFTSDNGGLHVPELKHKVITHNTPFRAGKGFLYEGGTRVPMILRWPGRTTAGRVVPEPVVLTDLLPTLLECAGLPAPGTLDGHSLAPFIQGKEAAHERKFFWHFPHYANQGSRPAGAVRVGNWKLIESYEDRAVELFNLREDPSETMDLSKQEPARVNALLAELSAWRERLAVQTNTLNPAFDALQHAALYKDVDVSRYNPSTAGPDLKQRVLLWRKDMDAAVAPANRYIITR